VVQRSQDFVAAKVDTEGSRREIDVAVRYEVTSLPTILFLSPEGRQLWRVNGFQGASPFAQTLESALAIGRNVIAWEQELAQNPDDPHALGALGAHLYEIGTRFYQQQCLDEARELLKKAVPRDGDQPSEDRRRTRMLLAILFNVERNYAEAEKLVKDALSLAPQPEDEPKLLFVLGRTYVSWGRPDEGIATMQMILRQFPLSPVAPKARETIVNLKAH
jgi:tetratricopeptide (TPR) repeat protein